MLRSMSDAVSGLQGNQTWMDVIGNDIANVSTPGFKSGDVNFSAMFAQTLSAGSAPVANGLGGTNPKQIGLGVGVGSITTSQAEGAMQQTGTSTNLAIQGDGYFALDMGTNGTGYSRVGDFNFDAQGNLVSQSTGFKVLGWLPTNGTLPAETANNLQDIVIPQTATSAPVPTSTVSYAGNLNAGTAAGTNVALPVTVYDSLGNPWTLTFTFTPGATANTWNWSVAAPTGAVLGGSTTGTITFGATGAYASTTGGPLTISPTGAAAAQSIKPNFTALTQYSGATNADASAQNGFQAGQLNSISIDTSGLITGAFSNGATETLGQVALATFSNPSGLVQQGQGVSVSGTNSGTPTVGVPGSGAAGTVQSGELEGSNVDLAQEFTEMITAERGYQANAQVVTVVNQMLQTLVQLGQ